MAPKRVSVLSFSSKHRLWPQDVFIEVTQLRPTSSKDKKQGVLVIMNDAYVSHSSLYCDHHSSFVDDKKRASELEWNEADERMEWSLWRHYLYPPVTSLTVKQAREGLALGEPFFLFIKNVWMQMKFKIKSDKKSWHVIFEWKNDQIKFAESWKQCSFKNKMRVNTSTSWILNSSKFTFTDCQNACIIVTERFGMIKDIMPSHSSCVCYRQNAMV